MGASRPRFELVRFLMEPPGYEIDKEHNENIKADKLPRLNQIQCTVTTSIIFDRETALRAANV